MPKLTYFAIRGRGELTRLVMAAARKQLEEVSVEFAAWEEMQPGEERSETDNDHMK